MVVSSAFPRIAEAAKQRTLIDQELRFFARLHRSARSELRIQLQRTLIGSKTLRKRGQVRQRHLPKTIAGAHAGARFDLCEGVLYIFSATVYRPRM